MEILTVSVVNVVLVAAAGVLSIPWLKDAVEVSRTRVTELSVGDDEQAERIFLGLLAEAKTEIVMYDDGDDHDGSLCRSLAVLTAIRAKLHENAQFRVACVLGHRTGLTLLEKELDLHPNVAIRERRVHPSRVHYTIVDGRKACVTCRALGKPVRNCRLIDCSNALSRRAGQRPLALRRYFADFEGHAG